MSMSKPPFVRKLKDRAHSVWRRIKKPVKRSGKEVIIEVDVDLSDPEMRFEFGRRHGIKLNDHAAKIKKGSRIFYVPNREVFPQGARIVGSAPKKGEYSRSYGDDGLFYTYEGPAYIAEDRRKEPKQKKK